MKKLNFDLKNLCLNNRDGSYATQRDRFKILQQIANDLSRLGFPHLQAQSLKPKHVNALVAHWKAGNLTIATIKNRLSVFRWWAKKIGKPNVVARSNDHYGLGQRQYVSNESKAKVLDPARLENIQDAYVKMSLKLQAVFGLRRQEAIKFIPSYADQTDHIRLKASWTKGGKARTVPIYNDLQRQVLNEVHQLVKGGALIPPDKNYRQQLKTYEIETERAGLNKMHGLRHQYAQTRYQELTQLKAPAAGGLTSKKLSETQKRIDQQARLLISQELGHEREQITAVYLGR